ncbi:hypothetical protein Daura_35200 [Dactylosporangium aurantiacum]|uniref:Uncharacterized protein n=1 Tax=Dactylosporangium aurantiacum TaxID=35754 RepID=A0A9Q9IEW1_9ACTN|nr:hypothetical protein [Dactylosporangium aurantiacum]MDG6103579.1 hypothetical protein [Dactylosporangium aurantiacum]UWZ51928.1 hypothetical protein Daura_35200 [Dactylosporangium aurantiacum]
MAELGYEDRTGTPDGGGVQQAARTAGAAARDAAGTAKQQAGEVAGEAKAQARNLARDVRDRVGQEARTQNDRLADGVRRFADELDQMAGERGDSPASKVVTQVSQGGRRVADYLAEHGPEGVLEGVQDFARRRPGTFLLAAAAAGFVVGRLGKGVFSAEPAHDTAGAYGDPYAGAYRDPYAGADRLTADTQQLPTVPVQPVPVQPVPVQPVAPVEPVPTVYGGGAATAAEPVPSATTPRS